MPDVGDDGVGHARGPLVMQEVEALDDQVLVLRGGHGRAPPIPAAIAATGIERRAEQADDDCPSHSRGSRERCASTRRREMKLGI
jgi:hypothetical protein